MSKLEAAQKRVDEAKAAYLALVNATKPLSRTMAKELRIENAWLALEMARIWLGHERNEEKNRVLR